MRICRALYCFNTCESSALEIHVEIAHRSTQAVLLRRYANMRGGRPQRRARPRPPPIPIPCMTVKLRTSARRGREIVRPDARENVHNHPWFITMFITPHNAAGS